MYTAAQTIAAAAALARRPELLAYAASHLTGEQSVQAAALLILFDERDAALCLIGAQVKAHPLFESC